MNLTSMGKLIALILRHKPETIGITLDEHGWANVQELIAGIRKTRPDFDIEILEEIVRSHGDGSFVSVPLYTSCRLARNSAPSIWKDLERLR